MKKISIIFGIILLLVFWGFFHKTEENTIISKVKTAKIGDVVLNIEIADSDEERIKGLSGREKLEEGAGLLFAFEEQGYYGIWMKDMKFSIDIIWLDKNKKIVQMEENVAPETFPKVFQPFKQNLYVLEVSAGFLTKNNIKIGDFIAF